MEARIRLENTDIYKHGKGKPNLCRMLYINQYPEQCFTIMAFLELIEFLFRLNKAKMIDTQVWSRWKIFAKMILTIPKFKNVWAKKKDIHSPEFRDFIDSL
jgi:hypothetical protein